MSELPLRAADSCRWDCISLGEVMLRLDPGDGRVHTTRTFQVWEGGGEYNVARGLKRCSSRPAVNPATTPQAAPESPVPGYTVVRDTSRNGSAQAGMVQSRRGV